MISLTWAGIATMLSGVITGLVAFLDAGLIAIAIVLFVFVREASASRVLRTGRFDRAAVTEGARVT